MTQRSPGGRRRVRRATIASVVAMSVALLANGCSETAPSSDAEPSTSAPGAITGGDQADAGVVPEGFTTVQARITDADGEVCEVCLWLADDGAERARGLMGVTDLGDAAGMLFRYDEPHGGSFYMFQTPTPLSIAWFAADGRYVGAAEMEPCLDSDAGDCPLYAPDAEYTLALEVFAGGLEPLGVGPGSRIELIDGTQSERCPDVAATP
jgi:uncharacterized membrane protein (UPF0127 family)